MKNYRSLAIIPWTFFRLKTSEDVHDPNVKTADKKWWILQNRTQDQFRSETDSSKTRIQVKYMMYWNYEWDFIKKNIIWIFNIDIIIQ